MNTAIITQRARLVRGKRSAHFRPLLEVGGIPGLLGPELVISKLDHRAK
jgi:hypothetical protein